MWIRVTRDGIEVCQRCNVHRVSPRIGKLTRTLNEMGSTLDAAGRPNMPVGMWLDLLEDQIDEARQHLDDGQHDKVMDEVADCVAVGYDCIRLNRGDPVHWITKRVNERITPRSDELAERTISALEGDE